MANGNMQAMADALTKKPKGPTRAQLTKPRNDIPGGTPTAAQQSSKMAAELSKSTPAAVGVKNAITPLYKSPGMPQPKSPQTPLGGKY